MVVDNPTFYEYVKMYVMGKKWQCTVLVVINYCIHDHYDYERSTFNSNFGAWLQAATENNVLQNYNILAF